MPDHRKYGRINSLNDMLSGFTNGTHQHVRLSK